MVKVTVVSGGRGGGKGAIGVRVGVVLWATLVLAVIKVMVIG